MRKNLINARQNKNLTQVEVAKILEVSERQYQRLEAGTSDGSIKIWRKLKDILNAETIDCLLEQEADNINYTNK
ncbi:MAG: helix-turn-helix transcriptional regulator [Clostridiales bacterium]|jgi:DNA-binding XRE family transcriptional regulator|nr:helix-turn-helix transcriptional regulator [Clostridiales bacterium]